MICGLLEVSLSKDTFLIVSLCNLEIYWFIINDGTLVAMLSSYSHCWDTDLLPGRV